MDEKTITFGKTDLEKLKDNLKKVEAVSQKLRQQKEDFEQERSRIFDRIDELSRLRPVVQDRYVSAAVERELAVEVEGADRAERDRTIEGLREKLREIDQELPFLEQQRAELEERREAARVECDKAEFDRLLLSLKTKSKEKQELVAEVDSICQNFETILDKVRHYNNHVVPQDIQQALALKQKYHNLALTEGRADILAGTTNRYIENFKIFLEDFKVSASTEYRKLPFGLALLIKENLGSRWER